VSAKIQSDRIFEELKREILTCALQPAAKINISAVCSRFGVSLGAAREALSRLISVGLVRSEAQKGFRVAPVSAKELQDLTEARIRIESACLEAALAHGDVEWETQIVASLHRLSRVEPKRVGYQHELNPDWSDAHAIFHHALVAACDNSVFLRLRQMLYDESERYRHWCLPLMVSGAVRDVRSEHQVLADAALTRDITRCCGLMREHLQRTTDLLKTSSMFPDQPV
jgi:GntR family transcriptional regulator, carbon starvation induced regulator